MDVPLRSHFGQQLDTTFVILYSGQHNSKKASIKLTHTHMYVYNRWRGK